MRQTVVNLLKSYGQKLSKNPKIMPMLAESREANDFLLNNKNAFLFGVIINQWIKSEKAWTAPFILFKRLGELDPNAILEMNTTDLEAVITNPYSLHRFPKRIAEFLIKSSELLLEKYGGNAENIWNDTPEGEELYSIAIWIISKKGLAYNLPDIDLDLTRDEIVNYVREVRERAT